jgi:hypothetical protein
MTDQKKDKSYPFGSDGSDKSNPIMKNTNEAKIAKIRRMKEAMEAKIRTLKEARRKQIGESLTYLLEFQASQDLEKAELVLAAKAILDRLQKMAEELAKVEADDLMPMLDSLKAQFGPESAERFNNVVTQKLRGTIEALKQAKDGISTQVMELEGTSGGMGPTNDMAGGAGDPLAMPGPENDMAGMGGAGGAVGGVGGAGAGGDLGAPHAAGAPVEGEPLPDELATDTIGADAANPAGRAKKESYLPVGAKRLRECSNPDLVILRAFRKALGENKNPIRCAKFVVERFGIDHDELVRILKEAKKDKKDKKDKKADKKSSKKDKENLPPWLKKKDDDSKKK